MEIQWTLVIFTLLVGMGAGMFAFVTVAELFGKMEQTRQRGAWFALGLVIIGGIASVLHLSHPLRAIHVLSNLNTSVGREFIFIGLVVLLIVAYIFTVRRNSSQSTRKAVSIIGLLFSGVLAFEVGATYVLPAQPAWNTYLLPMVYVASAAALGIIGMYVVIASKASDREKELVKEVNRVALYAVVVQAVTVIAYALHLVTTLYFDVSYLTSSSGIIVFWLGVVSIGLLVPFILILWFRRSNRNSLSIASISLMCVVIGGIAFRAMMYTIGSGFNI